MELSSSSFVERHDFLLRRLFSITGVLPVGGYMVIHLATNASLLNGAGAYQNAVYQIQSLGVLLPVVEWTFVFLPILFHAALGLWIIREGLPNPTMYPYGANVRYTLQRATGLIAFLFIGWHVALLHGWIHLDAWHEYVLKPWNLGVFRPFNAASTLATAFTSPLVALLHGIGAAACVFHFINGLWTAGITWGLWTTPKAMSRAGAVCGVLGLGLAAIGLGAVAAPLTVDVNEARIVEDDIHETRRKMHAVKANPKKHSQDSRFHNTVEARRSSEVAP